MDRRMCLTLASIIAIVIPNQALVSSVSCQINWNLSASPCIQENHEVRLICSYDGAPEEVEKGIWLRNGEVIYDFNPLRNRGTVKGSSAWDGRTDVVHVGSNDTLFEIKFPLRKADEGNYTCSIEVFEAQVHVNYYSTAKYVSLSISVKPNPPQIIVVGNKLVCTSTGGIPPPTFSWSPAPTGTVTTDTTSTISTDGRSSYTCTVHHCTTGNRDVTYTFTTSRIKEMSTQQTTAENSNRTKAIPRQPCPTPNDNTELGWGLTAAVMSIICLVSIGVNIFLYFKIRLLSKLQLEKGKLDRPDQADENIQGLSDGPRPTYNADGQTVNVDIQLQTRDEHPIGNNPTDNPQEDINPYEHLNDADRGPYLNTNQLLSGPYEALRI